ncbi:hypothetical protein SAMN05421595_2201 [Austwickia chelonae]|uniref:Uncharacterized protein n=1 Tax=Austwickia chelonae NBRC 105200 TaxID=1184607 RepID=K6W5G7_9MICO|nr:hypothetical protein [Austwickia chelonae]GAB77062.1 hypothetical protein AUCHE_04_01030 [Austwickia chelonae NBRC 105200]SEW33716.1 hypothetical protein SAMN05421595_2201 [Austwickia chelonae]
MRNADLPGPRLLVADHCAGTIHLIDPAHPAADESTRLSGKFGLSEHAGVLQLPDGTLAFVDDLIGRTILIDPRRPAPRAITAAIPVATPAEHFAADPTGRHLVVTTGLGANPEPWSDLLTVIDLTDPHQPDARRIRCRTGEPGVVIHGTGDNARIVLRHREPGSLEIIRLTDVLAAPKGNPRLRGTDHPGSDDSAHGDLLLPGTDHLLVAETTGVRRWTLTGDTPGPEGTLPWQAPGRGWFLRWSHTLQRALSVVRSGGGDPLSWQTWGNALWIHDPRRENTHAVDLGPGLIFRCAPLAGGVALTRVHPDGDEIIVVTVPDDDTPPRLGRRIPLPAMNTPPRPGHSPWENAQRRSVTADPHGTLVAVTSGGDGILHLVDTAAPQGGHRQVGWPTPLDLGGLLAWCDNRPHPQVDGVGR